MTAREREGASPEHELGVEVDPVFFARATPQAIDVVGEHPDPQLPDPGLLALLRLRCERSAGPQHEDPREQANFPHRDV